MTQQETTFLRLVRLGCKGLRTKMLRDGNLFAEVDGGAIPCIKRHGIEAVVQRTQGVDHLVVSQSRATYPAYAHGPPKRGESRVVGDDSAVGTKGVLAGMDANRKLPQA